MEKIDDTDYAITDIILTAANLAGKETLARGLCACQKGVHQIEMSAAIEWAKLEHSYLFDQEPDPCASAKGDLYSDQLVMQCLALYMEAHESWGGINVFDGCGRTAQQAEELCIFIRHHRQNAKIVVIGMGVTIETMLARTAKRTEDRRLKKLPPRNDDKPEIATKRFREDEGRREGIMEKYRQLTPFVHEIDANGTARQTLLAAIEVIKWRKFAIDSGILDPV